MRRLGGVIRAAMAHPYLDLLRDRPVRVLWMGLSVSALGTELYRVGAIWLAAELAGPKAALLVTAQSVAVFAVSVFGGPVTEALPRRRLLMSASLVSATVSLAVVVAAARTGLTFPMLVAAGVLLAATGALSQPVFLSSLPALAPAERLRPLNGLFDSTIRIAQALGPFLAAAAMGLVSALHLLVANAVSFLASAASFAIAGRRLDGDARAPAPPTDLLRRLSRGATAASATPGVWSALIATGVRGGAYALGFTVAVPVLFAGREDGAGLGAVALVFGAAAAAELVSGPVLVLAHPARPLRRQFEGYAMIGAGLAAVGAAASLPSSWQIPAMTACAFLMGIGNAVAGLQMMTFFGARLERDDYAAVLRLRLVLVIGAMALATGAGPIILASLGPAGTTMACGIAAAAAALWGLFGRPARTLGPDFQPV
jgi:MFS family permease